MPDNESDTPYQSLLDKSNNSVRLMQMKYMEIITSDKRDTCVLFFSNSVNKNVH